MFMPVVTSNPIFIRNSLHTLTCPNLLVLNFHPSSLRQAYLELLMQTWSYGKQINIKSQMVDAGISKDFARNCAYALEPVLPIWLDDT
jgi:hypothetical protein